MYVRVKWLWISTISICVLLAFLVPGCSPPQAEPVPTPAPPPTPALTPTLIPSMTPAPPATTLTTLPTPSSTPETLTPPSPLGPRSPVDGKLLMSKAPRVGETSDLTFTFTVHLAAAGYEGSPPTKAGIEFERYDPALYYPLGKGQMQDDALEMLSERFDPADPYMVHLKQAAAEQPETRVSQEAVLVRGDLTWEGEPLKERADVRLTSTVRFPEEGEWRVKGWLEGEGSPRYVYDDLYLTVTKDSGTFGWPKDYSKGGWTPPNKVSPVSVTIKPSRAPLLGEPFELVMTIRSISDVAQAEVYPEFSWRDGIKNVKIPLEDILVDGDLTYKGSLKQSVPIELSGTVKFLHEGDWLILGWRRSSPEVISDYNHSIYLHVGEDKSRFGWTESHQPNYEDVPPPPATKPPLK